MLDHHEAAVGIGFICLIELRKNVAGHVCTGSQHKVARSQKMNSRIYHPAVFDILKAVLPLLNAALVYWLF